MSKLLSLSNSNSKNNSYNANGSKENKNSREIVKKSNGSFNKSKGGEISSGNGSIESNNANITNINNSNSNNTYSNSNSNSTSNNNANNNGGQYSKNSITAKRKKFYDKLMKKDLTKKSSNNNLDKENNIQNNLNKIYDSEQFESIKNVPNNQSTSSNIKITNNTNIILNVKSGTKSLDIRALNNNANKDIMMRDMRELHIITKKAICSISTINPLLDTLDNFNEAKKQKNYSINNKAFNKKPMKELLINDNTDDLERQQVERVALGAIIQIGLDKIALVHAGHVKDIAYVLQIIGVLETEGGGEQHQSRAGIRGQRGGQLFSEAGGDIHLNSDSPFILLIELLHKAFEDRAVSAGKAVPKLDRNGFLRKSGGEQCAAQGHDDDKQHA